MDNPFERRKVPCRAYRITTIRDYVDVNLEENANRMHAIDAAKDHGGWLRENIEVGFKVVTQEPVSQEDLDASAKAVAFG